MKNKVTKLQFYLGMDIFLSLGYFLLPWFQIRLPALQLIATWTPFSFFVEMMRLAINQINLSEAIVENLMNMSMTNINVATDGLTVSLVILAITQLIIPIGALGIIIYYFIRNDELQFSFLSFVLYVYSMVIVIFSFICKKIAEGVLQVIAKQIALNDVSTAILGTAMKNCLFWSFGYHLTYLALFCAIGIYVYSNYLKTKVEDYYQTHKTLFLGEEEHFDSNSMGEHHSAAPFIFLENGGKTLRINKIPCVIGRNRNMVDYYLYDESLSRRHCMVDVQNGKAVIKDLNSLYGVRINDFRIEPECFMSFQDGDIIKLGEVRFNVAIDWAEINKQHPDLLKETEVISSIDGPTDPVVDSSERIVMSYGKGVKMQTVMLYPGKSELSLIQCVVNKTPFIIGRSKRDADYTIPAKSVSRKHAQIEYVDGQFFLSDLDSSNGTRVNGVKLMHGERRKLSFDDKLKFGDITFYFRK